MLGYAPFLKLYPFPIGSASVVAGLPAPNITQPFIASWQSGQTTAQVSAADSGIGMAVVLADSPPGTEVTLLTLAGATCTFNVRPINQSVEVLNLAGIVAHAALPSLVDFVLSSTSMGVLVPGDYRCSVTVLFPSGEKVEFEGLNLTITEPDA